VAERAPEKAPKKIAEEITKLETKAHSIGIPYQNTLEYVRNEDYKVSVI